MNGTWPTVQLGWVADPIVPQRDKPADLGGPIPWLRIEDFSGKYLHESKSGQGVTPEQVKSMPLRVFPEGTVVCSCSCTMGATAIASRPLITNQTFIGLVPREQLLADFLYYFLQGKQDQLQAQATGAIQQYLSKDDFKSLPISLPSLEGQRRIADFLDDQVTRIDNIIATRRQQVALLREAASAQLRELVRNKSHPNPQRRLARHVRISSGSFLPSEEFVTDGAYPVLGGNGLAGRYSSFNVLSPALAIGRVGALCGNVHIVDEDAWVTDNALVVRAIGCEVHFLAMILEAADLNSLASRTAQPLLTGETVKALDVSLPEPSTQSEIVDRWRDLQHELNERLDFLNRSEALLLEFKRSLISAAVSGEFDVSTASGRGVPA